MLHVHADLYRFRIIILTHALRISAPGKGVKVNQTLIKLESKRVCCKMNILTLLFATHCLAYNLPEPYSWTCLRVLNKQNFTECNDLEGKDREQCLCNLPEYLETARMCLEFATSLDVDPLAAMAKAAKHMPCPDMFDADSTSCINISQQNFNRIDKTEVINMVNTAKWRQNAYFQSEKYGVGLVLFWFTVFALRLLSHVARRILPSADHAVQKTRLVRIYRAKIILSPMLPKFGPKWLQNKIETLPSRGKVLILLGFIILEIVLLCVHHPTIDGNVLYPLHTMQFKKSVGIRTACFAVIKLPLVIAFASRNNPLIVLTGWSLNSFNMLHRWLSRTIIIDLVVHGSMYYALRTEQGTINSVWHKKYWICGFTAFLMAVIMCFHALKVSRRWHYDIFAFMHLIFSIIFIVLAWLHVRNLCFGAKPLIATVALITFDHAMRILRIALATRVTATVKQYPGVTSVEFRCKQILAPKPGRFIFVNFNIFPWLQKSHPFTVLNTNPLDPEDGNSRLLIRQKRGVTDRLSKYENNIRILVDGPYTCPSHSHNYDSYLFLAGGIGITAPLAHIQYLMRKHEKLPLVSVHWAVRDLTIVEVLRADFEQLQPYIKLHIYYTGGDKSAENGASLGELYLCILNSKLNVERAMSEFVDAGDSKLFISVCGPTSMTYDARVATSRNILNSTRKIGYHEEVFSW